jgi:hypothetical protein
MNIKQQILAQSPLRPILIGAGLALLLVGIFLLGVKNPDPDWHRFWMLRPLLVVPAAGGAGGFLCFILYRLYQLGRMPKALAIALGLLGYLVGFWMGFVLGLDGTLWN